MRNFFSVRADRSSNRLIKPKRKRGFNPLLHGIQQPLQPLLLKNLLIIPDLIPDHLVDHPHSQKLHRCFIVGEDMPALFALLQIFRYPLHHSTLLASAGIFSLALGMGAQGFVSDLVNGFFILSEDQFDVGDTVKIDSQVGTVVQLGLRTTRLKGSDGSIIYIPNRNISIVQNMAHGGISLNINLELDAGNDFEEVKKIIKQVNSTIQPEKKTLVQGPTIVGISNQNGNDVTFTVHFQVKPGKESAIRNLYLSNYIAALQKNDIKFAPTNTKPAVVTTKK